MLQDQAFQEGCLGRLFQDAVMKAYLSSLGEKNPDIKENEG